MSILDEIFEYKVEEIAAAKRQTPLADVRHMAENTPSPVSFIAALRNAEQKPALIAEVKRASPSKGLLRPNFDHRALARTYAENGATAVSVLTDKKYFQGDLQFLRDIHAILPDLPLLRKDFIRDPYQLYEARAAGASAALLIAASLEDGLLRDLHALALELALTPLIEVHTAAELERAMGCDPVLIGVNNRNLHDFSVDLGTTIGLRPLIPNTITLIAESGIHTPADVARLRAANVDAMLVGESLVVAEDTAAKVRELVMNEN